MSKQGKATGPSRTAVENFLKKSGIKRSTEAKVFTEDFWRDVERAGGTRKTIQEEGFSAAAQDVYFLTEELARRTLSSDFDRLSTHIRDFHELAGFPSAPQRIADLGGGPGLLAMWLALQHPASRLTVYDYSRNALEVGRKLAKERQIENIEFVQASYQQLVEEEDTQDCDLVLFYRALDFKFEPPEADNVFLYRDASEQGVQPRADIQAAATAMAKLIGPRGVGVIAVSWSEWGLIHLFEALRRTDLGVDWRLTMCKSELRNNEFMAVKNYIFVRHDMPRIARSAWEEARAVITCGQYYQKNNPLGHAVLESYSGLFAGRNELLRVEGWYRAGGIHRLRMMQDSGLVLLEITNTRGMRQGELFSLAGILEVAEIVMRQIEEWQRSDGKVQVKGYQIDPQLERLISFYNEGGIGNASP